MWTYFQKNPISYDLRKNEKLFLSTTRSARYETNSPLFRDSLFWKNFPSLVKNSETLNQFKFRLK